MLNNLGTAVWSGGRIFGNTGTINNQAGGTFEVQTDQPFYDGVFNNGGTFRKTAGTGTTSFDRYFFTSGAHLNTSGAVEVRSGTVQLGNDGIHSGSFLAGPNGTLIFAGGTQTFTNGCALSGTGVVGFQTAVRLGTDLDLGTLSVVFENAVSLSGGFMLSNEPGGAFSFKKNIVFPGSMSIAGTLALSEASLNVTIAGTLTLQSTGALDNPGVLQVGAFVNNGGRITGNTPVVMSQTALHSVRINRISVVDSGCWTCSLGRDGAPGPNPTLSDDLECK